MEKQFIISGMCCNTCITKINSALEAFSQLEKIELQFAEPQLNIRYNGEIDEQEIIRAIDNAGHYTASKAN